MHLLRRNIVIIMVISFLICAGSIAWYSMVKGGEPHNASSHTPQPLTLTSDNSQRLRDEIKTVEGLLPNLVDRGAALYFLVQNYASLGEQKKALVLLKECVDLDEGLYPEDERELKSLKNIPDFRELVKRAQRPAVHKAHLAFTIQQNDFFPEGLAANASKRIFYLGSLYQNKIVKITENGKVSDFVKEGAYDLMAIIGVHVDPTDHTVWCVMGSVANNSRSEIAHFDIEGKLLERYSAPGPGPHLLNDFVISDYGEIFVTDTLSNQVFRLNKKSHSFVSLNFNIDKYKRPILYPNGIALSGDNKILYIADQLGVIRFDLSTNEVQEVKQMKHDTLAGVDGLYWYEGGLVGVQNSPGPFRIMYWKLSPDGSKVIANEVLERGTEMVKSPTTGAILDRKFYFMANTGISNLDDNNKILNTAKLEPLHIAFVTLK